VTGATVTFDSVLATNITFESDHRLTAVTPAQGAGVVAVTVTNPGGKISTLPAAFTYTGSSNGKTITEAVLQNPADTTDASGLATVSINVVGHVQVPTVTNGTGQGSGVRAQVGFGTTVGATPAGTDFTWTDAAYVADVDGAAGDQARDSYSGAVSLPGPTTSSQVIYFLAIRFSVDDGVSWTIADRDGSANGVTSAQLARVTVTRTSVDWCKLGGELVEAPPIVSLRGTAMGPVVYGQVFKATVTSVAGAGAGIKGALGYGDAGTDPATWNWIAATFNTDTGAGANDEFQAQLPNPGNGSWKFAFRFNHADGPWSYCDADGLATGGFSEAQAGTLNVSTTNSCILNSVSASTLASGSPLTVTARMLIPGVSGNVGASPNLRMQIGIGPRADNASTSALWGWKEAAFSADVAGQDEFAATVYPAYTGMRAVSARATVDGVTWTYCDLNGSDLGGYEVTQQYDVVVGNHVEFNFCNLQSPATADGGTMIFGQIFQPGLTPNPAAPIIAQLGIGPESEDPGLAWTWLPATFNVVANTNNNEYQRVLPTDAGVGLRYAFRYSLDAGVWCYGDLNGSNTNGFSGGANIGLITP
jgi:hypothetical protein